MKIEHEPLGNNTYAQVDFITGMVIITTRKPSSCLETNRIYLTAEMLKKIIQLSYNEPDDCGCT